ncbi:MAG: hypothetical protein GY925_17770 [Actinomycetia bacterium]|nr:hypothetical protein [Actinomycetes bacterium]
MGRCSEAARLADIVADSLSPLSEWAQRLYDAVRQIGDVDDLGRWDARYRHVWWHSTSELGIEPTLTAQLFDAIFDFGALNLYGKFDKRLTADEYHRLVDRLDEGLSTAAIANEAPEDW